MTCPYCGKESKSGGLFCDYCDGPLPSSGLEKDIRQTKREKRKQRLLRMAPLAVAALIVLIAMISTAVRQRRERADLSLSAVPFTVERITSEPTQTGSVVSPETEAIETEPRETSGSRQQPGRSEPEQTVPAEQPPKGNESNSYVAEAEYSGFIQWR